MQYIIKTIKAIFLIICNPWLLNHVLNDNNVWKKYIKKNYNMDKGLPIIEIEDLLPGFSEELNTCSFLDGASTPLDLALLKGLARIIPDCKYFEIGTWRGESIINVSEVASECMTLNLPKEKMPKEKAEQIGFFSKNKENIIQLYGDTRSFNFASISKKFNLIFIDGDHHYNQVKQDTNNIINHLINEDSIIVWHDYAFNPEKIRYEVMAGILDGLPENKRNNLYHISNTLCAIYINKKIPSISLQTPVIPNKKFKLSIKFEKL